MAKIFRSGVSEQPGEGFRVGNFTLDLAPGRIELWTASRVNGRWEGIGKFEVVGKVPHPKPDGTVTQSDYKQIEFRDSQASISICTIPKHFSKLRNATTPKWITEWIVDLRVFGTDEVTGLPYVGVTHEVELNMEAFPVGTIHNEVGLEVTLG